MCMDCWADYDSPKINTPEVRRAAELVRWLYDEEDEITGGMLHVQLDDWNIEDCFWDDPFDPYLIKLHERQPLDIEREIAILFKSLDEDSRASALALASGYWTVDMPSTSTV